MAQSLLKIILFFCISKFRELESEISVLICDHYLECSSLKKKIANTVILDIDYLEWGSANFFCKRPHNKHLKLCRLCGLCCTFSTLLLLNKSRHVMNGCDYISVKLIYKIRCGLWHHGLEIRTEFEVPSGKDFRVFLS